MLKSSGAEICISAANWDKQSTWETLVKKIAIESWEQALQTEAEQEG